MTLSSTQSFKDRLLARIQRSYKTRVERVVMGPLTLDFLRCADPDAVLDQVAAEADRREKVDGKRDKPGDTLHLPYWAELWDSSYVIGAEVASRDLTGVPVLDLGCGMGLTAAASASAGAYVLAADLEAPSLLFAAYNTSAWRDRVRTRRTNWQTDDLGEKFPLIVGADILYEKKQWDFLDPFFRKHLEPGGEVLLGEPGRQTGEQFLPWAEGKGWRIRVEFRPTPTRPVPVRVITLTR